MKWKRGYSSSHSSRNNNKVNGSGNDSSNDEDWKSNFSSVRDPFCIIVQCLVFTHMFSCIFLYNTLCTSTQCDQNAISKAHIILISKPLAADDFIIHCSRFTRCGRSSPIRLRSFSLLSLCVFFTLSALSINFSSWSSEAKKALWLKKSLEIVTPIRRILANWFETRMAFKYLVRLCVYAFHEAN